MLSGSVAEPSLFRVAPAPEVRGPGARGEPTPAPTKLGCLRLWGKKRPLQAAAAPAPYANIFHFELLKSELLMQVFFGSHLPSQIALKLCFVTTARLSFFVAKKMQEEPS